MVNEDLIKKQEKEFNDILEEIKSSPFPKKIIVSGPGTGKTKSFQHLLKDHPGNNFLATTFLSSLVEDMREKLPPKVHTCTFHGFCKGELHQKIGLFNIYSKLPDLIERDAVLLGLKYRGFERMFQRIEENEETRFYLEMSNYYKACGFDDFVYRFLMLMRKDSSIVPRYDQVVVDEFQDFTPLEVAIIEYLEEKSKILIVGDDDQAIYSSFRESSPEHIRSFYNRVDYKHYNLPFCGRCPEVIVKATNSIVTKAIENGNFRGRIADKRFEFLEKKRDESDKFRQIKVLACSTEQYVVAYILNEIRQIRQPEIDESYEEEGYPTVLIIGETQYLREVHKELIKTYPQTKFKSQEKGASSISLIDGYELLIQDRNWNLPWRILSEFLLKPKTKRRKIVEIAKKSDSSFLSFLEKDFIEKQFKVLELIQKIKEGGELTKGEKADLEEITKINAQHFCSRFKKGECLETKEEPLHPVKISLTTFQGSKGLSGGRVFVVGMNNGDVPRDSNKIFDEEISKLIVAITRTRKCCYLISNFMFYGQRRNRSIFYSWIPSELIEDLGYLNKSGLNPSRH